MGQADKGQSFRQYRGPQAARCPKGHLSLSEGQQALKGRKKPRKSGSPNHAWRIGVQRYTFARFAAGLQSVVQQGQALPRSASASMGKRWTALQAHTIDGVMRGICSAFAVNIVKF
jgi:hypothetical protein